MVVKPLVNVQWLADHLNDPDLRVFDATVQVKRILFVPRIRAGRREWRRAHIPGSGFADLFVLSDPDASKLSMRHPTPRRFAEQIGLLGVGNEHRVVLYDRRESMWASQLWWNLRAFGHDNAAVLDGGWSAWRADGQPVCAKPCSYPPAQFRATVRSELTVGKEDVLAAIEDPDVCLINALGRRQHRGEFNEYGRRGHIPGSRNVTAWEILDRETGCYRSLPELREKLGSALEARRIITYCGAGAASSSLANVLVQLGHRDVAVYQAGLMEWCADRNLPLETGS